MSQSSANEMARLEQAMEAWLRFRAGEEGDSEQEFLSRHEELRDLLEPLLREDGEGPAEPPAEAGAEPEERVLGDFHLRREIDRGGMGVVYEAWKASLDRRVAVKVLKPDLAQVLGLLVSVARSEERILDDPEPTALFRGFGDSSLDFELRAWTGDSAYWVQVASDLLVAVNDALGRAGIEIDRKMLSEIAIHDPAAFDLIVELAKEAAEKPAEAPAFAEATAGRPASVLWTSAGRPVARDPCLTVWKRCSAPALEALQE